MPRSATVRVDNDLPAREPGVPHRAAEHELPGRVHENEVTVVHQPLLVVQVRRQDGTKDTLDDVRLDQVLRGDPVGVLRGHEHALDFDRTLPSVILDLITNRHLCLAVGPQVGQLARLAHLGEPLADLVREHDRKGHQLLRLVRRVTEHHSLVAGADPVERIVVTRVVLHLVRRIHALRDVGRLLVERNHDAAGRRVEAPLGVRVADLRDPIANDPRHVDIRVGRNLAGDDDEAGGDQRLAGDAAVHVVGQDRVEHRVRDLVGDLVGMALGDGL